MKDGIRIAFAGGGTGGHLLPGISVAQAGRLTLPGSRFLFLGTDRPAERKLFERYPFPHLALKIAVPRRNVGGAYRFSRDLFTAIHSALKALKVFRPHVIVGLGGYASVPGVLAARRKSIPVCLMEQNAQIGWATSMLTPLAQEIFCGYPSAAQALGSRGRPSGNPLRVDLASHLPLTHPVADHGRRTLLVMGGSQGAKGINNLLGSIAGTLAKLKGLRIIHLAGPDVHRMRDVYERSGIPAGEVLDFDPDVGRFLRKADLVISRAGAMAVSEIAAFARPAVFIPYPFAGEHQTANALPLVLRGGAALVKEDTATPQQLADLIHRLLNNPRRLKRMSMRSASFASPDAAQVILQRLEHWGYGRKTA
ncbi:MAG: UDP-N-acetylglucosamine--N-acetylmuramyl-(pentapeptide) pyrophosphoryl-undecaprenol N-acetylglucosamine transferase [Planctomycetota bacterium]|jgi:UDP-N-acetylglucosamine--N-acetylmuramyl-(pentapeptide) pyrophosphoryl-undecaprenol N-acetylglucosamine transferase